MSKKQQNEVKQNNFDRRSKIIAGQVLTQIEEFSFTKKKIGLRKDYEWTRKPIQTQNHIQEIVEKPKN